MTYLAVRLAKAVIPTWKKPVSVSVECAQYITNYNTCTCTIDIFNYVQCHMHA